MIDRREANTFRLYAGSSHPELARQVAQHLGIELGQVHLSKFRSGELYAQFPDSVRGVDVYLLQTFSPPINDHLMELLLMIDALKRSSAGRINVIIPYFGYGRQEKQGIPREPISAKVVADVLTKVGAHRVITVDLHAPAIQGFFDIPVDHLTALSILADEVRKLDLHDAVVVSPDAGRAKTAEKFAAMLDVPMAIMHKGRPRHNEAVITHLIGDVKGKTPVVIEDIIDTGGTITQVVENLVAMGAGPAILCATHGIFSPPAEERLTHSAIQKVVVTDTLPLRAELQQMAIQVLPIAPLLAKAIGRVHYNLALSTM
ncbi:ribose-phosphate diphosphokinase [Sulfoacidibacillus thermotolerans]|uniref:Ribose-phosphate pyrophosphokinase n=1 Tax=Sulfoacidibacillus thermotolerans TaxID=1765684 RepID=A0A2U3DAV1_SULT2|nr:ribose-phosphate pyrophosphokinase [Sulfoacidibacillus thermotolerans]PWI58395.1 ribose-phosphate pyrophosphokinase [Sulfoacidibacillus thermotolerans]